MHFLYALILFVCMAAGSPAHAQPIGPAIRATGALAQEARSPVNPPQAAPIEAPKVVGVTFTGLRTYPEAVVLNALGIEIGKPLKELRVRDAFETFGIVVAQSKLSAGEGGVILELEVSELDVDPEVQFLGVGSVSVDKVREWAGLGDRTRAYIHEADRIANRIQSGYKKQGFQFAEVEWAAGDPEEGSVIRDLIFNIHEGPKVRCIGVKIEGNEHLPETGRLFWKGGLRKLAKVQTAGRGIFRWYGKVFQADILEADLQAMREIYRDRGWLDAKVEIKNLQYNKKRNRVLVEVMVDEGPLYLVESVSIEGVNEVNRELSPGTLSFPEEELLALCNLRPGVPLERARFLRDQSELALYYGDKGYLGAAAWVTQGNGEGFVFLEPRLVHAGEDHKIHVTYRLIEGRPVYARHIGFSGNVRTRDKVLRREVSVLPGKLLSQRELDRSRRRLLNTSFFSDPSDPSHPQPSYRLLPVPGSPDEVDVMFEVEEGRNVDLRFTGGIDSNSGLVGIVSLGMRNFEAGDLPSSFFSTFGEVYSKEAFHGNGESFSLNLSPGSEVDQWSVDYSYPDAFGTHFDRTVVGFSGSGRDRRYKSHDEGRNRFRLYFSHLFDQGDVSLRVGAVWQELDISDLDTGDLPTTLTDSPSNSEFIGLNTELRWSGLDNNQLPRAGHFLRAGTTVFGGPFGGDNDLIKTELSYDYYRQMGSDLDSVRPGIHLGLSAGVAAPFGDSNTVHYGERFFGGGSKHLRGFPFRGVGPNNGDYPLGGESMLGGTLEWRQPIYTTPIAGTSDRSEVFRLIFFTDWGIYDPEAWALDTDELRVSAGIGLGMLQPLPLTFNLGWPVRDFNTDGQQVFSFSLSLR